MDKEEKNLGESKSESAKREEAVLEFWRVNKIFNQTLEKKSPKGEFVFYDGPVTANSKPVLHTMAPFAFKDVIPRYKTMRGYHVRRKGGWDTHGLPVELQIEKKLGFKSKIDIENYGIADFNKLCKESVWEYIGLWKSFTERMGYWADQKNPYVTYHNDYIESVWNVVKKVDEQKLLYKDYKVVPWCPRCGTALSSHELAQGYEDVKDLSVYVKFRVLDSSKSTTLSGSLSGSADPALPLGPSSCETPSESSRFASSYVLAWTTTPWTLPGNVALAVGENIDYVKIKVNEEFLILAKARLSIIAEQYEVIEEMRGKDLVGLEYEPLYPFLKDNISKSENQSEKPKLEKAYKVYGADFVTTEDGTGIVHTAVMYGQDDFELGTKIGLPKHHLVGLDGKFLAGTGIFEGRFVKPARNASQSDAGGDEDVAIDIIKDLAGRGLLFKKEKYEHSYPHCWRCKTALIYYARDSWYIRMSDPKIKKQLIDENKEINWEPEYIREGRFGEWLREIKDWAISRERYWGTPLPVWTCESCHKVETIGSISELKEKTKKSGNEYFVMRHGGAENNVLRVLSSGKNAQHHLTEEGKDQVKKTLEEIKSKKFDLIFFSPLVRTTETAVMVAQVLELKESQVIVDERLEELQVGDLDGKSIEEYFKYVKSMPEYFTDLFPNGESRVNVHKRTGDFLYEVEKKYSNKKILIISHGDPIMAMFLNVQGYTKDKIQEGEKNFKYFKTGEVRKLDFVPIPHNEDYELDLHKPYIDEIHLLCAHSTSSGQACGNDLVRTKEVMDVWFDSGAMPFAQDHYPFDFASGKPFENKKLLYPADYICEAIDQTRGWFYTLHAVGILMGRGKSYKNVISLGHLLDAKGKKMSKSIGNVVDPWVMMEKYGVDTLRLWMYSVNQPGESKNFDEKTVVLLHQQVFGLLYNVLAFYELYRDKNLENNNQLKSENVLDVWILAKLDELIKLSTENLDNYKLLEPVRAVRDFVGDLSTWYLRRSRDRIKEGDKEARQTLYFILKTLAKILAPFAPFTAEDIWLKLQNESDKESVHLVEWPKVRKSIFDIFGSKKDKVLDKMQEVRKIVSLGLEARQKSGLKVRQPLALLKLKVESEKLSSEYLELIKDELNVKEVKQDKNIENEVELDTNITEELKQEGNFRELVRALQDMRKKMELTPSDVVEIVFETSEVGKQLIQKFENEMKKTVLVSKIEFSQNDGELVKIDELEFKIEIRK